MHAREQIPQGYFGFAVRVRGPGLTSRSPDIIRRAESQPVGDLLKLMFMVLLFRISSVDIVEQGVGGVSRTLTLL